MAPLISLTFSSILSYISFSFIDQQCFTVKMTIVARMEEPVQMEFVHVLEILQEMIVLVIK